jgi:hypothetical protein
MNKFSKIVKEKREIEVKKPVVNFMGGISYQFNPLDTLKMVSASSIFAEPQYYRESGLKDRGYLEPHDREKGYLVFDIAPGITASELMIKAVNDALDYDFGGTLDWAKELRHHYYMRLNPQLIMVLASVHPKRIEYSQKNPGAFRSLNTLIMYRADEPASQLSLYLYLNDIKSNIPSILKRSWADRIENMSKYEISKYKNADTGLIDTIRICHAKGKLVDELMTTGTVQIDEEQETWERLRSAGKSFKEIMQSVKLPHMALLRNLRNIFKELDEDTDRELASEVLNNLVAGVKGGKQFPFRYYQAYNQIKINKDVKFKTLILDKLEECIDISIENMPKLKGKTICLSDNSGSAWGTFNSEYGTMTIAEIDNLSSVITCMCSDEGYVGAFGDELIETPITKRNGALSQAQEISSHAKYNVGSSTENGIWLFFQNAIDKKIKYDNIFIYSDMQAGHAGLYGKGNSYIVGDENFAVKGDWQKYIDVLKLIRKYRETVNPKVNVFSVQTAGYNNVLIPEYLYRGALLYGWTGKEPIFASELVKQWDELEK